MRKILLFLVFIALGSWSVAQITLTHNDFPTPGITIPVSNSIDFSFSPSKTGANVTWDFSNLEVDSSYVEHYQSIEKGGMVLGFQFGEFSPKKYKADYFEKYDALPIDALSQFGGNFLPIDIKAVNRIVKVEDNQITYPGYSLIVNGQQIGFRSDTIEVGYQLPLTYGDSYTSRGFTDFDFSMVYDAQIKQHRQRTSEVDGYGTVLLPYKGKFQVVRIHHHIEESDSIRINAFGFSQWFQIPRTRDVYEWWSNKLKRPVLKVAQESIMGNSITSNISFYVTLPDGTYLYPNPATDHFTVLTGENLDKVIIYNMKGKKVLIKNIESPKSSINVSQLSAGRYTVQTFSGKTVHYYPIVIL